MEKTFLFLADGFEEIEAITAMDILRRADIEVVTVSIYSHRDVIGSHGVSIKADSILKDVFNSDAQCMVLPGGMPGAQNLSSDSKLMEWLQIHIDKGGKVAAICAAPGVILGKLNIGRKIKVTTYPGFESYLQEAIVVKDGVVVDKNIITGKGPAFAMDFALKIVEELLSSSKANEVAGGLLR